MSKSKPFPVTKAFLYSLVASVLLSALLGIIAILSGKFGWFEIRIILTTVAIAAGSICGLACSAYLTTTAGRALPLTGIVLAFVAAALIIAGMWSDARSEAYWNLTTSTSVFAVAFAHLSLLSMARLAAKFQWSLATAYVIILGVACLIVAMIYFELHDIAMFQLLGVVAIADAAISILVPIFHRLSRSELPIPEAEFKPTDRECEIESEIRQLKRQIAELERMKHSGG